MDSSVSPTHGEQEGTAYNGHFGCTCYHPLFLFNQSATWRDVPCAPVMFTVPTDGGMFPVVMRYKERKVRLYFRGDAAFASPEIYPKPRDYSTSSASKRTRFSSGTLPICLRDLSVGPTMFAVSTPFSYQAGSWNKKRRVVPWSGTPASWFLASVSSLICRALKRVVAFYNHRGTAEQHIKEGKNAINWTRLSCRKFGRSAPASRPGLQSGQLHEDTAAFRFLDLTHCSSSRRLFYMP